MYYTLYVRVLRSLYGGEVSEDALQNTSEASEDRRKKLIYHLNQTGHYHAYKEHIKKSVLELVRQKFINEATTSNEEELQVCDRPKRRIAD